MTRSYPCHCGCGVVTVMGKYGRPRKFATDACRKRCQQKVRFLACVVCGARFTQHGRGNDRQVCGEACAVVRLKTFWPPGSAASRARWSAKRSAARSARREALNRPADPRSFA